MGALEVSPSGPLEVVPSGPLAGSLAAPPSKSMTNRLLAIAALASGTTEIVGPLVSEDTEAMSGGIAAIGCPVDRGDGAGVWSVAGTDGRPRVPGGHQVLDARQSGTTLRFMAALAALAEGTVVLDGAPGLRRRPIEPLLHALEALGAFVESDGGRPPVTVISAGLAGGEAQVDAAQSSQFATALLLVAPYANSDVTLEVHNLGAGGYVDLTIEAMTRFGASVEHRGDGRIRVRAGDGYRGRREPVGYDASAAAHLWALAAATGGEVAVDNAEESLQPDARILDHLAAMGAVVRRGGPGMGGAGGGVSVRGPSVLSPIEADLSEMPDQLPTLAVLAALAPGLSRLSGLGVARGHETDRLYVVALELSRLGVDVETGADWIEISGGRSLSRAVVETHGDHRMAMAFAALGAAASGVTIGDPACVAKTYPGFFDDAVSLGLRLRPSS